MGSLAIDNDSEASDTYVILGLEEMGKGVCGTPPRILKLIPALLERSVQKNMMLLETGKIQDVATIYHGLRAPSVSIQQYVDRIFKYSGCSPSCFVVAHIYLDRFLQRTGVHITNLNVHRLLITSIMVAAKFTDDAFFNNAYYAKVGGVSTGELNSLEMKFLFSMDFRLKVNISTFGRYCSLLEKQGVEGLQVERPIQTCRIKDSWSSKDDSTTCAPTIAR